MLLSDIWKSIAQISRGNWCNRWLPYSLQATNRECKRLL